MAITTVTSANFESEVLNSDKPVLVDFWAAWCPFCTKLAPHFEAVAGEMDGDVKFARINIDDEEPLSDSFNVDTIPTLMLFRNGKALGSVVAPGTRAEVEDFIRRTLAQ